MKSLLVNSLLVLFVTTFLNGCNTAKGFGQDMQEGGKAIEKSVNDTKSN
ncbi:MAG: entericidin A/B family lipoprotein [Gammaproteobacteria bacterium]